MAQAFDSLLRVHRRKKLAVGVAPCRKVFGRISRAVRGHDQPRFSVGMLGIPSVHAPPRALHGVGHHPTNGRLFGGRYAPFTAAGHIKRGQFAARAPMRRTMPLAGYGSRIRRA